MGYPWSANDILTAADLNAAIATGIVSTGLGAWTSYTPTWTSLTVGNATQQSAYWKSGRLVVARIRILLGSTSSITGSPVASLPVTGTGVNYGGGQIATYRDSSASTDYNGIIRLAGTTGAYFLLLNVAGANDQRTHISSTTPFTWATGDLMEGYVMYESAS